MFVLVGLASPGPNIIMLIASGARLGFRRTLPYVIGIALGVAATAGLGLGWRGYSTRPFCGAAL